MYAYFMAAICVASGLLLIFRLGKEQRLYYPLGGFLIALGAWNFADQLTDKALSGSPVVWLQRAVLLAVIVMLIIVLVRDIRASKAAADELSDEDEDADGEEPDEEETETEAEAETDGEETSADECARSDGATPDETN